MKRIRLTVQKMGEPYLECTDNEHTVLVDTTMNAHTQRTAQLLRVGMCINAVSCIVDTEGVIHPQLIIIEPDFLVEITAITGCLKEYGDSAFNHLIAKLQPSESTVYTLLGDFANQFLDDAFNSPEADYSASMRHAFGSRVLSVCACPDINSQFFADTRQQFDNIKQSVSTINSILAFMNKEAGDREMRVQLEPSFFCETLGIQGRMDCLITTSPAADARDSWSEAFLIELKSGKWDEYRNKPQDAHAMQMLLYKEVLFYNMGVKQSDVSGNLLYSRYPRLQELKSDPNVVQHAMNIRNSIVCMELGLAEGKLREWLPRLTPQALRKAGWCGDNFWTRWCMPRLQLITNALHGMDSLTAEYFHTMLQFIEREQIESKTSESSPNTDRAMATLWNTDVATKLENGDIIVDLKIVEVKPPTGTSPGKEASASEGCGFVGSVCLRETQSRYTMPNIRIGDAVILYQRNSESDSAVTQQVVRCSVESQERGNIWLKLRFPQHSLNTQGLFAIEHDHIESTFRSLYSSLFSLVTADSTRRDLLLCQREPQVDTSLTLTRHYLNPQIDSIVLRAKQARDMFLLMGPPGTGKTSVALRSMVEEFLASGCNILLLAYTNRAVDEICEMLADDGYLRIGNELSCAPQHRPRLLCNMLEGMTRREEVRALIDRTRVFASTVASMNSHPELLKMKHFDVAIFDEASQILEPHILSLLTLPAIGKFIMIGDHKQLPAVVVQSEEASAVASPMLRSIGLTNCRNSLFERLYERHSTNSSVVAMLDHQGRMHPDICSFPSQAFYDGRLQAVGLEHQTAPLPFAIYDKGNALHALIATSRTAFIDIPLPAADEHQPKANVLEAKTIAQLIASIIALHRDNNLPLDISSQIGVIVPFRRQIALVRREIERTLPALTLSGEVRGELNDIVVDTVERYQGSQRDIIIYGTTITQPAELDILSSITPTPSGDVDRKLNVALTRARKQLFILGNRDLLSHSPLYSALMRQCNSLPNRTF